MSSNQKKTWCVGIKYNHIKHLKKKKTNIQSNKELHRETLDICIKFICTSPLNLC